MGFWGTFFFFNVFCAEVTMYHKPLSESTIQIHSGRGKIETTVTLDLIGIFPSKKEWPILSSKKEWP